MATLKSPREIENQMYRANTWVNGGQSQFEGMTFEEGVEAALRWALGEEDAEPIEKDFDEDGEDDE